MELLLKTYADKPSRIGITYKYEYLARQAYEELIRQFRGHSFSMELEPLGGRVNLCLRSDQNGKHMLYKDLEYKPELLQKLERLASPDMELQFVHLYKEANALLIAKPFRKQEFFSIGSYTLKGYGTFT